MGVNEYIYHNGDTNTYLRFQTDQTDLSAGGNVFSITSTAASFLKNDLTIADTKTFGTSTFISGISGDGFRFDDNGSDGTLLEVDNIVVRNTLRTHIFQKDVVKATNGILFISDSGVISGSAWNYRYWYSYSFDEKSATFSNNQQLLFKDAADDGTINSVHFTINGSGTSVGGMTTYNVDGVVGNLSNLNLSWNSS